MLVVSNKENLEVKLLLLTRLYIQLLTYVINRKSSKITEGPSSTRHVQTCTGLYGLVASRHVMSVSLHATVHTQTTTPSSS